MENLIVRSSYSPNTNDGLRINQIFGFVDRVRFYVCLQNKVEVEWKF